MFQCLTAFRSSVTKVIEGILIFQRRLECFLVWEVEVLIVAPELHRQDNCKRKTHLNDEKHSGERKLNDM